MAKKVEESLLAKFSDWYKVSQYKHYVSLANLIRVIRLDCI